MRARDYQDLRNRAIVPGPRKRVGLGGGVAQRGGQQDVAAACGALAWPTWVGPFLLDQAPVPSQQRARRHDPAQAQMPGSSLAKAASTARSGQSGLRRATYRRSTSQPYTPDHEDID